MVKDFYNKLKKAKRTFDDIRTKVIVRVWNLGSRLDPKQMMKREKKKKKK